MNLIFRTCPLLSLIEIIFQGRSHPEFTVRLCNCRIDPHLNSIMFSLDTSPLWGVLLNVPLLRYHPLFLRVTGMTGMSTRTGVLTRHTDILPLSTNTNPPLQYTQTLHRKHNASPADNSCLTLRLLLSNRGKKVIYHSLATQQPKE